jgi:hypothetical protein
VHTSVAGLRIPFPVHYVAQKAKTRSCLRDSLCPTIHLERKHPYFLRVHRHILAVRMVQPWSPTMSCNSPGLTLTHCSLLPFRSYAASGFFITRPSPLMAQE